MKYAKEIEDEEKGHEHYEHLAAKDKPHRKPFKRMSADEEKHEKMLRRMSKHKALKEKQEKYGN